MPPQQRRSDVQMDYLVGCHEVAGRLHVCGGSNSGALASFPVASSAAGGHFGAPAAVLRGAHTEPVRLQPTV